MDDKLHSIKVYAVVEDEQWKNIGAGQISSKYVERLQGMCLLVHSESDGSLILECKIHPNVPYYKQQGEVIIWSEAKNHGMAIQFQEPNGCQEIWEDICQVQGKDSSVEITQELTDDMETFKDLLPIWNLFEMPKCELHTLENIADLFTFVNEKPRYKERLKLILEKGEYIKKLLQLFNTCETLKNMEGLHYLNRIIKGILLLDDARFYNIIFSDEFFMDMVGCLEYDPALDQPKQYREFLTQNAKFKEIVPITHSQLRQTIQKTYRMQYVHDIMLPIPSRYESNLLSDLTNTIVFNKTEIITMLQEDENFLLEVFAQLKNNTIGDERRHELLLFLKELCVFGKALEHQEKGELLKTLIKLGIMNALKVVVHTDDYQIRIAALEIFAYLVDYNPCLVRKYLLEEAQDSEDNDDLLINIMINQMICESDPEFSQGIILPVVLHALLDPDNMHVTTANRCEEEEFLNFFYTHCINTLITPILSTTLENVNGNNRANICPDNYQNVQLLEVILEILTFCVQYHSTYIKNYILSNNLLSRILVLLNSKHTCLILCVVRFMRKMIGHKDENYNSYIITNNLFEPVVNAFVHNGHRYNMLNSAIIELFEFIRQENIKSLIANIVENFFIAFKSIEYVQTFKGLKIKYEEERTRRRQVRRNFFSIIYQKIFGRCTNVTEVKVKADTCKRITEGERAIVPRRRDFPSNSDINMKTKTKNESENVIEHQKRKSSEVSKCCPSHADPSASRMSGSHCSSMVPLEDYPCDSDGENNDEDKDEDEEPPAKRPNLN